VQTPVSARGPTTPARKNSDAPSSRRRAGPASPFERMNGIAQDRPIRSAGVPDISYTPEVVFGSAPFSCVRWLKVGGREAVAAVGTSDGGPGADSVIMHAVRSEGKEIMSRVARRLEHHGKVTDISTSSDSGMIFTASSDGSIRCLPAVAWDDDIPLQDIMSLPKSGMGRESAVGVAPLHSNRIAVAGAHGTLLVVDAERGTNVYVIPVADAVGIRAIAPVDPEGGHEFVSAGASGVCSVWDSRTALRDQLPTLRLKHPNSAAWPLCVTIDAAQPHFILSGTSVGELVIWDRRGGAGFPLSRATIHDGFVWDVRVVASSRPGLLLSCGEDARVWHMDFAAAASRGGVSGSAATWRETGEFWRAELSENDVRNVAASAGATLGVNSVDAHPHADLFAYASDSAAVTFGSLYSQQDSSSS
jgi:WD40 repeat protein